jgi:phage-related tail protein
MSQEGMKQSSTSMSFMSRCLGIAILVVALAGAYRVATGDTGFQIKGDSNGFEIKLEQAQRELNEASAEISKAQEQVRAQAEELQQASNALAARERQLNGLVASLQERTASASAVTPEVKRGLSELNQNRANELVNIAPPVDARTFKSVDQRLERVHNISKQLTR